MLTTALLESTKGMAEEMRYIFLGYFVAILQTFHPDWAIRQRTMTSDSLFSSKHLVHDPKAKGRHPGAITL